MKNPELMPDMGENITLGLISQVIVKSGDRVAVGDPLVEVESEKVTLEVTASSAGIIEEIFITDGEEISPGKPLLVIVSESNNTDKGDITPDNTSSVAPATEVSAQITSCNNSTVQYGPARSKTLASNDSTVYAGPSARRLCRELGVPIDCIPGTAGHGRITVEDIKAYVRHNTSRQDRVTHSSLPDFSSLTGITREIRSNLARTTARNISNAWKQIPHAWIELTADITEVEALRKKHWRRQDNQTKISLTIYLLKVLGKIVKEFPFINACFDEETEELVLKTETHLGFAVDTPRGLLVPVVRNVDRLSLTQLAEEVETLTKAARSATIEPDQLRGSSMTISNLGSMGVKHLFPIVNWPEVAILGVGGISVEPVWKHGNFIPRSLLSLTLGFDHRVINGADAARFLGRIRQMVESPLLLTLS
ncbi:MAG: 2-oxo acid dehydrogenase subunit E2 [Desulfuromonadales bacterium]|nr:2-oxo acid dehydrogenase subunit E2 [Desulfuromonadales bacterium]MBN2792531.1 2-oxo acid dehydrogenase subunit E2 [Desulfuromonadales bacterium]